MHVLLYIVIIKHNNNESIFFQEEAEKKTNVQRTLHHLPLIIADLLITRPDVVPVELLSTHCPIPVKVGQVKDVL